MSSARQTKTVERVKPDEESGDGGLVASRATRQAAVGPAVTNPHARRLP